MHARSVLDRECNGRRTPVRIDLAGVRSPLPDLDGRRSARALDDRTDPIAVGKGQRVVIDVDPEEQVLVDVPGDAVVVEREKEVVQVAARIADAQEDRDSGILGSRTLLDDLKFDELGRRAGGLLVMNPQAAQSGSVAVPDEPTGDDGPGPKELPPIRERT